MTRQASTASTTLCHKASGSCSTQAQSAWVEQDPLALWQSVVDAVDACLVMAGVAPVAVAVANQRESVVLWERRTGEPLGPCVVWQCTRRRTVLRRSARPRSGTLVARAHRPDH